jgi:hypothetical protein
MFEHSNKIDNLIKHHTKHWFKKIAYTMFDKAKVRMKEAQ